MIASHGTLRRLGWVGLLALCCAMLFGLALRVNAVKSEVRLAERRILALKRETLYLETEFETRASQQQLEAWNDVEFGYIPPTAGQYLEGVRDLAAFGKPAGPGAPAPIRVAAAPTPKPALPTLVSPLTGNPIGDGDDQAAGPVDHDAAAARLGERLGTVVPATAPAPPVPTAKPAAPEARP